jgi:hypothetical protein
VSDALALMRARAIAREQSAELSQRGRWGAFARSRFAERAYIDHAATDATHMSYLVLAGRYQRDWSYARARFALDCATRTATVEYFVSYNEANEIIAISGPSRPGPMGSMFARDALAAACASSGPIGRTYTTLTDALIHLRREAARN